MGQISELISYFVLYMFNQSNVLGLFKLDSKKYLEKIIRRYFGALCQNSLMPSLKKDEGGQRKGNYN